MDEKKVEVVAEIIGFRTIVLIFIPYLFGVLAFFAQASPEVVLLVTFCSSLALAIYLIEAIWRKVNQTDYEWNIFVVSVLLVSSLGQALFTTLVLAVVFSFF